MTSNKTLILANYFNLTLRLTCLRERKNMREKTENKNNNFKQPFKLNINYKPRLVHKSKQIIGLFIPFQCKPYLDTRQTRFERNIMT